MRPGSDPEFSTYFKCHIEEDLIEGMILPVRRSAGLRDEYFYHNTQECSNFKYKSKIREKKMSSATGYRVNIKCTLVEAIASYKEQVDHTRRDLQRSILRMGSYRFSPSFQHLERSAVEWGKMTESARRKQIERLDLSSKAPKISSVTVINLADSGDEGCSLSTSNLPSAESVAASSYSSSCASGESPENTIGFFKDSGLPEFLRGSWQNANKIVNLGGIGPHPTESTKRCVLFLSQSITHTVEASRVSLKCDNNCPRFEECSICAHNIAVAHSLGRLREFVQGYKAPLTKMLGIPAGSRKKEDEKKRMKRKRKSHPERDVSSYGDRNKAAARLPKSKEDNDDNTLRSCVR